MDDIGLFYKGYCEGGYVCLGGDVHKAKIAARCREECAGALHDAIERE